MLSKLYRVLTAFFLISFLFILLGSKETKADSWVPVNFNGNIYYISDTGIILTNAWAQIGDGIFYFGPDGAMVTNTVIDGYQIGSDGRAIIPAPSTPSEQTGITANSLLAQYCIGVIGSITNEAMTQDQKLAVCYSYVVNSFNYNRTYETPMGDWTGQYALELFSNGYGNCYRYAAGFAYLAKALGYEVKVITGQIHSARGGVTPHSWVEIFYNGAWYICDPELQMAKGYNLYMKTYINYPVKPLNKQAEWMVHF